MNKSSVQTFFGLLATVWTVLAVMGENFLSISEQLLRGFFPTFEGFFFQLFEGKKILFFQKIYHSVCTKKLHKKAFGPSAVPAFWFNLYFTVWNCQTLKCFYTNEILFGKQLHNLQEYWLMIKLLVKFRLNTTISEHWHLRAMIALTTNKEGFTIYIWFRIFKH